MLTETHRRNIESVDSEARTRTAFKLATQRVGCSWAAIADDWEVAVDHLIQLRLRGLDRADFANIELMLSGVIADLFPDVTDLNHIRRLRSHLDREDDRLTDLHGIDGPHAVSHRELAGAYRKAAVANWACAEAHEQIDRDERRNASRTIERLRENGRAS